MPRYRVQGPDGQIHVFEGPEGASPADIEAFASQAFSQLGGKAAGPAKSALSAENDPGVLGSMSIGAGHTVDNVLDGLTQWWLNAKGDKKALEGLKTNNEAKKDLYKPLQEQHPVATAVGEAAPSMVIPAGGGANMAGTLTRLAIAGAVPGALEYGTVGERGKRAAGGAAAAMAGGVLVPKVAQAVGSAIPAVGRVARAVAEPLTQNGRANIAGRTLNRAAGGDASTVAQRLGQAAPLVPGSMPTAAQIAENGGIASLERSLQAINPADFTTRAMEQAGARSQALRGLAGDDATMAAATKARDAVSGPLFDQAKAAVYQVDGRLANLLERPAMAEAMKRAEALAANQGRKFQFFSETSAPFSGVGGRAAESQRQITGQGLQDLKMAIDEMLGDHTSGFSGAAGAAVKGIRGQLLNWMEEANPVFKAARTTHADMSKPMNQMQIGRALEQKLQGALGDHGALASETGASFARALRDADQFAKTATGFKGAGMAETLTPDQMQLVSNIAKDLARKANAQNLGRGAGSDTVQKLAMTNLAEQSGAPGVLGSVLNMPGVNKLAKFAYSGPDEQIQSLLAQSLLDPKLASQLMTRNGAALVPKVNPKQLLLANPSRATQLLGGGAAESLAQLFAQ